jgi:hypothetical protein
MSRRGSCLLAAALLTLLPACSMFEKKDERACPRIEVVGDLSRLVKFQDGPGRDLSDIVYMARVDDVKSGCKYDKTGVTIDLMVSLLGERGRAGAGAGAVKTDATYFGAVTDRAQNIIDKPIFTSQFDFADKNVASINDEFQLRIALSPTTSASDHTIIVGFQLTPEEIDFNERNRTN